MRILFLCLVLWQVVTVCSFLVVKKVYKSSIALQNRRKIIYDSLALKTHNLKDSVCVVTGASRGIGKGIAIELGKAGATVYVTGTSSSAASSSSSKKTVSKYVTNEEVGGEGTIEETAERITEVGGVGIPYYCDHSDDAQVKSLFDTIERDYGRLDILVNNAFRVPSGSLLEGNFWEQGARVWDAMHTVGLRSSYVASCYAVPLMLQTKALTNAMPRPMIAMISSFGGIVYTFNVAYGVGKAGVDRLAKDMAVELQSHNICVTSFWPGVVMTERMKTIVEKGEWDSIGLPLDQCETPAYTGQAILAVATDANNLKKSGTVQIVAELAKEYDFVDPGNDGSCKQPPSIRSLKFLLPSYLFDDTMRNMIPDQLIPDWKIPLWLMAGGRPDSNKKV